MICKAYASGNNCKIPNEYALETTVLHIRALISEHFHCSVLVLYITPEYFSSD
jgi:hypothetical protein